ncbi:amidohydrolase family protein [Bradyrhizobium sp. WYCCWR 13023]|uniref:Amidohydrolase family protein n=1 Tax=Bradyrhizobium zhengyangense TaxID=2911009 RepID=A0A9X1RFB4_9BRAD|nr:amidohydrolase family protein [Bradyrhizobium zhengyangense]
MRDTNGALAEAIAARPKRLAGFAALPLAAPDQAAKELGRRFKTRKFVGAVIKVQSFWPLP